MSQQKHTMNILKNKHCFATGYNQNFIQLEVW